MKRILLSFVFALPILGTSQTIINKTFDSDVSGWSVNGTNSTVTWDAVEGATAPGCLKLDAAAASGRAQTSPNIAPINGNGDYTLVFKVKGTSGTQIQGVAFQQSTSVTGGSGPITLTGGWDTYTATFTIPNATNQMNIRIIALNPGTYFIDDVEWTYQIPPGNTTLKTAVTGKGTLTVNPVQGSYDPTTTVSLTAIPATHFVLNNWSGDFSGSANPASLLMDTNKNVTANFGVDPSFNYEFLFNADGDQEGWDTTDTNMSVTQSGGIVTLAPTANQFARYSLSGFSIPAANYNKLTIKYKNNSSSTDQLAFVVNNGTDSSTNVAGLLQTSTSSFVTESFDLTKNSSWTGTITELRLRFSNAANGGKPIDSGSIEIDEIILTYDVALSTGDINKTKTLVQVYVIENKLNFRNANVTKATIFSMNGQVVKETKVANNNMDIASLKPGVYIVKATAQDGSDTVTKFIKK